MKWLYGKKINEKGLLPWMKDKRNRIMISALAGLTAAGIMGGGICEPYPGKAPLAWWGSIYPEFCFARPAENEEETEADEGVAGENGEQPPRLSFWLAKALDW